MNNISCFPGIFIMCFAFKNFECNLKISQITTYYITAEQAQIFVQLAGFNVKNRSSRNHTDVSLFPLVL